MKNIDRKILEISEKLQQKEKILIHLRNLEADIQDQEGLIFRLERQLREEERDVQQLESLNWHSLFQTILGQRAQQMEKERQEYLQAVIRLRGAKEGLQALREDHALVERMISGKFALERQMAKLIQDKRRIIDAQHDPAYQEVYDLDERLAGHRIKIEEIRQAIKEGEKVKNLQLKIRKDLEDLERWGGGQRYHTDYQGKSKVKRIEQNSYRAQSAINRFHEELKDLHDHFAVDYQHQVESIQDFLRRFTDCLITDWVIPRKVQHSLNLVSNILDKVKRISEMLRLEIGKTEGFIQIEEQDRKDLILRIIQQQSEAGTDES
ncbi:MAG: hypothetical protein AAFW73_12065 [Bacteroidota bacterium]